MSSFEVKIRVLRNVEKHPDADRLDVAMVDGYRVVVQRGRFKDGDLAIYVPEQAIVPEHLLKPGFWNEEKGKGLLAGSKGDRVKAVKLRGVLSQGILLDLDVLMEADLPRETRLYGEGTEVGELLGIHKWEPPVPAQLSGQVYAASGITTYTDIENIKRFPDVIPTGEEVVMTEKLHGTCLVAYHDGERVHVSSKGIAGKNLALEDAREKVTRPFLTRVLDFILRREVPLGRRTNFYWRALEAVNGIEVLNKLSAEHGGVSVTLYGEGLPAQDLKYGFTGENPTMRAFDLKIDGQYVDHDIFVMEMNNNGIPVVPVLYRGPFTQDALDTFTNGKTTLDANHVREGVVVKPVRERRDEAVGRVILKSISEKYLTRKNATEFN